MTESTENDFTEASYRALLDRARSRFRFCRFGEAADESGVALWRHDIDFSPHRALALARLENERGLTATYFVLLGSAFYNPFEPDVRGILRAISALGHDIGLHYDATTTEGGVEAHVERLEFETKALIQHLGVDIRAFSLHNPSVSADVRLDAGRYSGLINASAPTLRERFSYASDSNGRWRFRSLHEVIEDPAVTRLYALTHPEWWTPEVMPPSRRVERCIKGRADRVGAEYRAFLSQHRPDANADR